MDAEPNEARIVGDGNVVIVLSEGAEERLPPSLCGTVLRPAALAAHPPDLDGRTVYLCGDVSQARRLVPGLQAADRVFVIADLSHGYDEADGAAWSLVDVGRVPVLVHGVGVLYRRFFDPDGGHFERICAEHVFQDLTQSTKPGKAHRTGIYLTPVERRGDALHFRLLRCSTNLSGPTENFRATDHHVVDALNQEAAHVFAGQAPLNHVLAQIYHNTPATSGQKQTKAKIKAHADKTKDMPDNGIMAFVTFYRGLEQLQPMPDDPFDLGHGRSSGLTRLVFRKKAQIGEPLPPGLAETFTVTLYPGSVLLVPLSTNRWYTHEIRPSMLDAAMLPTRLGYVVRCSGTEAVHRGGQTFIETGGRQRRLEPPTPEGMVELKGLYAAENRTDGVIDYADRFGFSMNAGDYLPPHHEPADGFRRYDLSSTGDPFAELAGSTRFQDVGKGRRGNVLVRVDPARGIPIVRTTTRYDLPAQCFRPVHVRLARRIREAASLPVPLNNALIERYTNAYRTMGLHSDQAQDLQPDSFIALYSCYRHPERTDAVRVLVVEPKDAEGVSFEVPLLHDSVVVFSLDTNRRFRHKIVLPAADAASNEWLGVTLRTSATFVRVTDGGAHLEDGAALRIAHDDEREQLYRLRGRENRDPDFAYPPMPTTLSPSDLLPPDPA